MDLNFGPLVAEATLESNANTVPAHTSYKTPLCILAEKYFVDKCPTFCHYYTPQYHKLLADKRFDKVLEIGIGYKELMQKYSCASYRTRDNEYKSGASLYMWKEYFPNSRIFGCDIRDIKLDGIDTFVCDQSKEADLIQMIEKIGSCDFIIDDGSHILEHQVTSFKTLWKYCNDIYIIEDVPEHRLDVLETLTKNLFDDCIVLAKYKHPKDTSGFICYQKIR